MKRFLICLVAAVPVLWTNVSTGAAPRASSGVAALTKLPNLRIGHAGMEAPKYVFRGRNLELTWHFSIENVGSAKTHFPPTLLTGVELKPVAPIGGLPKKKVFPAGRYAYDSSVEPGVPVIVTDVQTQASTLHLPLGKYLLLLCTDLGNHVKESNEGDNCRSTRTYFYVIKRIWEGTVFGTAPPPDRTDQVEKFRSDTAELVFSEYREDTETFLYRFRGTVKWTDDGTDAGGCAYSGGPSSVAIDHFAHPAIDPYGGIGLSYDDGRYLGNEAADSSTWYDIHVTCPTASGTIPGPLENMFLAVEKGHLAFGQDQLEGRWGFPNIGIWNWEFA